MVKAGDWVRAAGGVYVGRLGQLVRVEGCEASVMWAPDGESGGYVGGAWVGHLEPSTRAQVRCLWWIYGRAPTS